MTLHEAASVFLIIGGVLLGPISGRPGKIIEPMMENCGPGMVCARHPGETTAETCIRAMKEIGVRPIIGMNGVLGSRAVHCIPAPSGLIR